MPISIILDTDIGDDIDDALALTVAVNSPEITVVGVTTVFRDAPKRALLTQEVLRLLNRTDVPVYAGVSDPIIVDWENLPGGSKLGRQFEALDPNLTWSGNEHAVDYIIRTVREFHARGEELVLVPIGPLTNIALAFRMAPDIISKCRVVLMGGKWKDDFQEWNIRCDPEAAQIVFSAGAQLDMVGLDVTLQCVLTPEEDDLFINSEQEHARFLGQLIKFWGHKVTLHDPLTILTLFSDVVQFEPMRLEVGLRGDQERARTVKVEGEPNARGAVSVDVERAKALFLERALRVGTGTA